MSLLIILVLVLLTGCASQPTTQQTFILTDAQPLQRVTFQMTLSNAHDQNGTRRDGTLSVTSMNDGQRHMLHMTATDTVAPVWLKSVDDNAVFVTENQERRIIAGECTRDASGFPPVSMRDILGPLQGFAPQNDTWQSTQGGPAWSAFTAQAVTDSQVALTSMTGQGQGKVLLPGGDVITADITWIYLTESYPVTIAVPSVRCESQGFDGISFPSEFGVSSSMGGALLFTVVGTLPSIRDTLISHWQNSGFAPIISDENQQSVIIEIVTDSQQIRAFLVQKSNQTIDITIIRIEP
ncbi:MAG: hypothetical protein ACO3F2_08260 [Roseiflexaceae bacterium]